MKNRAFLTIAVVMMMTARIAGAAGLASADAAATNFKTWLFGFIGICAIIYLLYLGAMAKVGKKTWGDFGMGVVHVAVVGSVPVLGSWAWSIFA